MVPAKQRPRSRYSMKRACANIELAMGRSKPQIQNKELAQAIGLSEDVFSRKLRQARSSFTLEELGLVADFFGAPPGWPMVDADARR